MNQNGPSLEPTPTPASEPTPTTTPTPASEPTPTPATTAPKSSGNKSKWLIGGLVALLVLAGFGYLIWQNIETKADLKTAQAQLEDYRKENVAPVAEEPVVKSDSELIIEAALAYAEKDLDGSEANVELAKHEGDFARVQVVRACSQILKKISGEWTVLYCAQADSEETMRLDKEHGVPESIKQS